MARSGPGTHLGATSETRQVARPSTHDRSLFDAGAPVNNAAANFPYPPRHVTPTAWRRSSISLERNLFLLAQGSPGAISKPRRPPRSSIRASYAWTGGPGVRIRFSQGAVKTWSSHADRMVPTNPGTNVRCRDFFPTRHDGDITGNLDRTSEKDVCQPALRLDIARAWLGRDVLGFALCSIHLGPHLVVDGANWQRRSLTNPPW